MTNDIKTIDQFVRDNVICNVSCLVSDTFTLVSYMANNGTDPSRVLCQTGFDYDDMLSMMQSDDWESPAREHIEDLDRDDLVEALEAADITDDRDDGEIQDAENLMARQAADKGEAFDPDDYPTWTGVSDQDLRTHLLNHLNEEADGWKDFCDDNRIDPEITEVFEHWAINDWFGRRLKERGETVVDFGNLDVWCRTTTGQAISMDYVIGEIYKDLFKKD